MKSAHFIITCLFTVLLSIPHVSTTYAESIVIPDWINDLVEYWKDKDITDMQFYLALKYLIDNEYIYMIDDNNTIVNISTDDKSVQDLIEIINLDTMSSKTANNSDRTVPECRGYVECFEGIVKGYPEPDIIRIGDKLVVTSIATSFKSYESGSAEAKQYMNGICPVGSKAFVDIDEVDLGTISGHVLGLVYCNGLNLNYELANSEHGFIVQEYCSSEFGKDEWAIKLGCPTE